MALDKPTLDAYIQALYDDDGQLSSADYQLIINYILSNGEPDTNPRDLMQMRRGDFVNLPNLAQGEPAITLDTEELFVGGLNGNIQIGGLKEYVNVKKFGAKGDGITDDTLSFLNAIAKAKEIGGVLFIPKGTFKLTQLNFEDCDGMIVTGVGRDRTILDINSVDGFNITNSYSFNVRDLTVKNAGGHGVKFTNSGDGFCVNVTVEFCAGNGFHFDFSWNCTLLRCRANRNDRGVYCYNSSHSLSLIASQLSNSTQEGLYIQASNALNINGGSIELNNVGIRALNVRGVNIGGVYFEANVNDCTIGGLTNIAHFVKAFNIQGNYFNAKAGDFTAATSIVVNNGTGAIKNNSFREYTGRAIYLSGIDGIGKAEYIDVANNTLENVAQMFSMDGTAALATRTGARTINSTTPAVLSVKDFSGLYLPKFSTQSNANVWWTRNTTTGEITINTNSVSNIAVYYELTTIGLLY